MNKIVANYLGHDGMRTVRIIGDREISQVKYVRMVAPEARTLVVFKPTVDELLDIHSLEMTWPVYGPFDVAIHGPKKFRRFMFINFAYAARVSDCIALARTEYFARTHFAPSYAFAQSIPEDKEGELIHDCILLSAEWMPARCVAIGGRDD